MKVRATRSGLHLFDRRTGLNVLIDELSLPREQWATAPRHVSIALTNACDLSCNYCYAAKHHASLNPSQVLGWAKELDALGCLGVGFGGGEPTLYRGFVDLCAAIATSTNLAVQFTTHGHRLTQEMCDRLVGNVSFVRVSMDGVGATYERLRGRSFEALREKISILGEAIPFGINCVINQDTISELDKVREFATTAGADELLLLPERSPHGEVMLNDTESAALTSWINSLSGPIRLAISELGVPDGIDIARAFPADEALDAYARIDASGVLKTTSFATCGAAIKSQSLRDVFIQLRKET